MIGRRRRGYQPYRPPPYVTNYVDDFPLVPEIPIDIIPRPILPPPRPPGEPPAALARQPFGGPVAAPPAAPVAALAAPIAGGPVVAVPDRQPLGGLDAGVPAPSPLDNKAAIACLEAAKELALTAPSVANEMLRILESKERPALEAIPATAIVKVAAPKSKLKPQKKSHPKKKKKPSPPPEPMTRLELHQSHCKICGYEDRDEIDEAFVSWENVSQLAEDYNLDRRGIYRHAHATGLFAKRDRNIRRALGRLIQEADNVTVTADSVVRAIKLLTHVSARGDWVQPPTHVIFSSATAHAPAKRSDTPCKVKKGLKP